MLSENRNDDVVFDVLASYREECTPDHVNGVMALSALCRDDNSLCLNISFDGPGICRSRPLFIAAVEAAASALWFETYHALYGEEALPFTNEPMLIKHWEAGYENVRNSENQ